MDGKDIEVKITQYIDDDHKSHYWYGGQCAIIYHKGYKFLIEANGDVCCEYIKDGEVEEFFKDKSNSGRFYKEMRHCFKNDDELYQAINNNELMFDANNWWECFVIDPNGEFHDLMLDLDASYLDEAVAEVKEQLDNIITWIPED